MGILTACFKPHCICVDGREHTLTTKSMPHLFLRNFNLVKLLQKC